MNVIARNEETWQSLYNLQLGCNGIATLQESSLAMTLYTIYETPFLYLHSH